MNGVSMLREYRPADGAARPPDLSPPNMPPGTRPSQTKFNDNTHCTTHLSTQW